MNEVGRELKEVSKSIGNVLNDPIKGFGVLSDYARRRVNYATGYGKALFTLAHADLKPYTTVFEACTRQLAAAVDRILRKHGKDIVNKQFATRRLADIMIDLFALASVFSRVSTSLQTKDAAAAKQEVDILAVFCGQVSRRVRGNFNKIDDNDDELIKSLADHAFTHGGYSWDNL